MRRINNLQELREEYKRLKARREYLETEIKKEFREIKESLAPMQLLADTAKKSAERKESHLIGTSAGSIAFIIARAAFQNSGIIKRVVVPYLVRGVATKLAENNQEKILNWAGKLAKVFSGKRTLSNHSFAPEK